MTIHTRYMTENDCYKQNRTHGMQGIMVHSTATPGVMAEAWYSRWNKPGVEKMRTRFCGRPGGGAVSALDDEGLACGTASGHGEEREQYPHRV